MNVTLVGPDSLREIVVEWLDITTMHGHMIIMRGHAPLIAQLAPHQTISMKLPGGAVKTYTILGGVVRVDRASVTIITEL